MLFQFNWLSSANNNYYTYKSTSSCLPRTTLWSHCSNSTALLATTTKTSQQISMLLIDNKDFAFCLDSVCCIKLFQLSLEPVFLSTAKITTMLMSFRHLLYQQHINDLAFRSAHFCQQVWTCCPLSTANDCAQKRNLTLYLQIANYHNAL